jgi:hypothetical protein
MLVLVSPSERWRCNLSPPEREDQARAWRELGPLVTAKERTQNGFRVTLARAAHEQLKALVVTEQRCCGWAHWSVVADEARCELEVTGPESEMAALAAAFGL